jgi:hypothetical protein
MFSLDDLHAQIDEALAINSIESTFSYDFYTDLINGQRALFMRNEYNRNRSIDPYVLQDISCLQLELVNPIDCCIDVPTECKVLRTTKIIPNTIELYFTKGIATIGSPDILKPRFVLIDYSRVPYIGHGRTTQKAVYAFLYNQYIYVVSKDPTVSLLKYITVRGIFEDPTELTEYVSCVSGKPCYKSSDPYPINMWMWEYIKPQILNQLMQKGAMPLDNSNDANDTRTASAGAGVPQPAQQQAQQQ